MLTPLSAVPGIAWPALPNPRDSLILSILYQLEQTQWWPVKTLEAQQMAQLTTLLAHAYQFVPFYRDRLQFLATGKSRALTYEELRKIPILSRQDVQDYAKDLLSQNIPQEHLPTAQNTTSGSTGKPVTFQVTRMSGLFLRALNLRSHLWHQHNLQAKVAAIKVPRNRWAKPGSSANGPANKPSKQAGIRWADCFPSGIALEFDSGRTITEQLAWLQQEKPEHLLTYPSNLLALAQQALADGVALPSLKNLSTFGEVLTPKIRQACREAWGLPIVDIYSCQEMGVLALQCPEHEHYHIQSESVIVEVLDDAGLPCQPGQVGRVVLTDLHNYAMPLIRYEIGDYAEVGEPCSCGRKLPVLTQVLGRTRNMLVLPSGEKLWPSFVLSNWAKIAPIKQLQVIQHSLKDMEVKMVLAAAMEDHIEASLRQAIAQDLDAQFQVRLTYVNEIPRSANGKYEDFVSKLVT